MTTITDAARAVANVARLLQPAGSVYVFGALGVTPAGGYARKRRDLRADLEYLAADRSDSGSNPGVFDADTSAAIRAAAADALVALTDVHINEHFLAALKTALTETTQGVAR